jgi:hypothetical protein
VLVYGGYDTTVMLRLREMRKGLRTMILTGLKNANLALMFFLELGALAATSYWGFQTGSGMVARIGLGIGAPAVMVLVWSLFGAPKARYRLHGFSFLLLKVIFFGSAALALFAAGSHVLGIAFALAFVFNSVLIAAWKQ